jgi:hypothetical protein
MSVSNGPNLARMISAADGDAFGTDFRKLLRALDVLLQGAVISKTLSAPPGSPANGDRYIVAAAPTGAWSGQANSIAVWTTDNPATPSGLWEFYPPKTGWLVYNVADTTFYSYSGTAWVLNAIPESGVTGLVTDLAACEKVANKDVSGGYGSYTTGTYTPVAAGTFSTTGTVTLTGSYVKIGKLVFFQIKIHMAAASTCAITGSGNSNFSLPFTAASDAVGGLADSNQSLSATLWIRASTSVCYTSTSSTINGVASSDIILSGVYQSA